MKVSKKQVLDMLVDIGRGDLFGDAARTLPDPVDTERDANLLARHGLEHGQLLERFGGSP